MMLGKSNSGMPFYRTGRPRRKIESDPQQPKHILSMLGVGYACCSPPGLSRPFVISFDRLNEESGHNCQRHRTFAVLARPCKGRSVGMGACGSASSALPFAGSTIHGIEFWRFERSKRAGRAERAKIPMSESNAMSSLTTRYRDLRFLVTFGTQLLMYATPVIYPVSAIPDQYRWLILANPLTPIIEGFRFAFLGAGAFDVGQLLYSFGFMVVVLLIGILLFNQVERTFMDTV